MPDPIETLRNAVDQQLDAEEATARALQGARDSGLTLQQIGDVFGITRQGALYLVQRADERLHTNGG